MKQMKCTNAIFDGAPDIGAVGISATLSAADKDARSCPATARRQRCGARRNAAVRHKAAASQSSRFNTSAKRSRNAARASRVFAETGSSRAAGGSAGGAPSHSGARSTTACTFVPVKPKLLTAARLRERPSVQFSTRTGTFTAISDHGMCGEGL